MVKPEERMFAIKRALKTQLVFSQNSLMATCPTAQPGTRGFSWCGTRWIMKSSAFLLGGWRNHMLQWTNGNNGRDWRKTQGDFACDLTVCNLHGRLVTWWTFFCAALGNSVSTLCQGYNILILPTTGRFFQVPGWRWCMVYVWGVTKIS